MGKSPLYCMIGSVIGVAVAQLFAGPLQMPIVGWFIGGSIMAFAANYSFPPPKQRSHIVAIASSLALGVVITVVKNLMTKM